MNNIKSWREKLTEIGGYENDMLGVPAGTVVKIIEELEKCQAENTRLGQLVIRLQKSKPNEP